MPVLTEKQIEYTTGLRGKSREDRAFPFDLKKCL